MAKLFAAILATMALAGCVSVPKTAFDKSANAHVRKVAVLRIAEPRETVVMNIGGAAGAFGLVGGLVQAGINQSNTDAFKKAMSDARVTFAPDMEKALHADLRSQGYEVVELPRVGLRVDEATKQVDYSQLSTDADAILHVWVNVNGYVSSAFSLDYQPWIAVGAEMVDAKSRKRTYYQVLSTGLGTKHESIEPIESDAKYRYGSASALLEASPVAIEGLKDTQQRMLRRVAQQLK
jgi:hypothetical protein